MHVRLGAIVFVFSYGLGSLISRQIDSSVLVVLVFVVFVLLVVVVGIVVVVVIVILEVFEIVKRRQTARC